MDDALLIELLDEGTPLETLRLNDVYGAARLGVSRVVGRLIAFIEYKRPDGEWGFLGLGLTDEQGKALAEWVSRPTRGALTDA